MEKISAGILGLLLTAGTATAADMPGVPPAYNTTPVLWSWTGLYLGIHVGGGSGSLGFADPSGPSIYGGVVHAPKALGGAQLGYNWQAPNTNWVFGFEIDAGGLSADGTNTCLASSGFFISANCRVRQNATGSVTARIGLATGGGGHTLLYAKGGAAWLNEQIDITTNGILPLTSTNLEDARLGWTVGAGVERALTPAWSVKLEYDYASFGSVGMATPASYLQVIPASAFGYVATPNGSTTVSQTTQTLKLGLNLKFGADAYAKWDGDSPTSSYPLKAVLRGGYGADGEIEIGARAWYSSGKYQKDLGGTANQAQQGLLVSRLTYDTSAVTGELFGRVDSVTNLFLKGFIGGGNIIGGKMHDEDWVIFGATVPYSNTVSDPIKGSLGYATIDVGYAFLRGSGYKVGAFAGYNYFRDNKSAYGCTQIANANSDCVPSVANSVLGITEDDKWNSLRIGLNGVFKLTDRLTLTGDAAYLPYAGFQGG